MPSMQIKMCKDTRSNSSTIDRAFGSQTACNNSTKIILSVFVKRGVQECQLIVRNIASVSSTKNISAKIIDKITNSRKLQTPYLATLNAAGIIIGELPVAARQVSGHVINLLC